MKIRGYLSALDDHANAPPPPLRFPVKTAWYPSRNIMSSKLSLFTTLFLILGPIYQKVRHLLGARPRAVFKFAMLGDLVCKVSRIALRRSVVSRADLALASTPTVNDHKVRRYPTPNARSPNGSNPREGRAVDSLGPTRTLVGGDSCAPTLVFCLECRVLVPPSTALSCLAVVPVVCYSTRATRA